MLTVGLVFLRTACFAIFPVLFAFCISFIFFSTNTRDWLGRTFKKITYFAWNTQKFNSINQSVIISCDVLSRWKKPIKIG